MPAAAKREIKEVSAYLESLPEWSQTLCKKLRAVILSAYPEITERVNFFKHPYCCLYLCSGNKL